MIQFLMLRAAWAQADKKSRRKWFDEIVGEIFSDSDTAVRAILEARLLESL
jgi:hypothetical protein